MKYQKLGNTDIEVSKISLGTWGLGGGSVWTDHNSTLQDTELLLDACLEHGINYIDTAPVYGTGESEMLLGKALQTRRDKFILQTKCSLNWRNDGGNFHYSRDGYTVNNDTSFKAIKKDVEDSLMRMHTDYIDSIIVHYVCKDWSEEETVAALEELKKEGKIRAYGLSNSKPDNLEQYEKYGNVSLVQEFFSILSPFHGREYFQVCKKHNTVFQVYGVLEEGFLTGPSFLDKKFDKTDIRSRIPWVEQKYHDGLNKAFEAWKPLCDKYGCSYANLVQSWALEQFEDLNLLVGMRKVSSVEDSIGCLDVSLTKDEIQFMEDVVKDIQVEVLDK
jgi:methylglyoxal reductase